MATNFRPVMALVRAFCENPYPSQRLRNQLADLVSANIGRINASEVKQMCAILANCDAAPRQTVLELSQLDPAVCSPLLVQSTVLNDEDLCFLIDKAPIERARAIARRQNISRKLLEKLRQLDDEKITRSIELRQKPLLKIMSGGADKREQDEPVFSEWASLSQETVDAVIHTSIADTTGLSIETARQICQDHQSKNLPTLLRYLDCDQDTAWLLYARLAGDFAKGDDVESTFRAAFDAISKQDAIERLKSWMLEDLTQLVLEQPVDESAELQHKHA